MRRLRPRTTIVWTSSTCTSGNAASTASRTWCFVASRATSNKNLLSLSFMALPFSVRIKGRFRIRCGVVIVLPSCAQALFERTCGLLREDHVIVTKDVVHVHAFRRQEDRVADVAGREAELL